MKHKNFTKISLSALAMATAVAYAPASNAALAYSQNWEGNAGDWNTNAAAISDAGFTIGQINHSTGGEWFAGFAAPNNAADGNNGFSSLVSGEGSAAQGDVQLSVYGDYNGWGPWVADPSHVIQSYVINDLGTITADMVGNTYSFGFDAKLGNLDSSVADADVFVKVLEQTGGWGTMFESYFDSDANLTTDWSGGSIDILIDAVMVGELLQFGFTNTTDNWNPTGVFYDNLNFAETSAVPVPAAVWLFGSGLLGLVGVARRRTS